MRHESIRTTMAYAVLSLALGCNFRPVVGGELPNADACADPECGSPRRSDAGPSREDGGVVRAADASTPMTDPDAGENVILDAGSGDSDGGSIVMRRPCRVAAFEGDPRATHPTISAALNDPLCDVVIVPGESDPQVYEEDEQVEIARPVTVEIDGPFTPVVRPDTDHSWIRLVGGGDLTIRRMDFEDADTDGCGSVISVTDHARLSLAETAFRNNRAENGGAICVTNQGWASLTATTLVENSAERGGAIYVDGASTLLVDGRSTFDGNLASENGGAIFAQDSTAWLREVELLRNEATSTAIAVGGAIFGSMADVSCARCFFHDNVATTDAENGHPSAALHVVGSLKLESSTISANRAEGPSDSGETTSAVYAACGSADGFVRVANSTLHGNVSQGGSTRNALSLARGYEAEEACAVHLAGNTITDNSGLDGEGQPLESVAIHWGETLLVELAYTIVWGHAADCGAVPFSTLIAPEENVIDGACLAPLFFRPVGDGFGFRVEPRDPLLGPLATDENDWIPVRRPYADSPLIDSCSSMCQGQPECEASCLESCASYDLTTDETERLRPIAASCDIGAIESVGVCGNREIELGERCDDGNESNDDACPTDCWRRECRVGPEVDPEATHRTVAAAANDITCYRVLVPAVEERVYHEADLVDLKDRYLVIRGVGGRAHVNLRAGDSWITVDESARLEMRELDITSDEPSGHGSIATTSGTMVVENSRIADHVAHFGGAFSVYGGDLWLLDSVFEYNRGALGGVVWLSTGSLHVADSTFTLNRSPLGGAINSHTWAPEYGLNRIEIENTLFELNRAEGGDDANGGGALFAEETNIEILDSMFRGNRVLQGSGSFTRGGALSVSTNSDPGDDNPAPATTYIRNTWFDENTVMAGSETVSGGAISNFKTALTIEQSSFTRNQVTLAGVGSLGGAIYGYCGDYGGTTTVENSTFHQNGGASQLHFEGNNPSCLAEIIHSTITQNNQMLPNAGIAVNAVTFTIDARYSILYGHALECARDHRSTLRGAHNLWSAADCTIANNPPAEVDPQLRELTEGSLGSPPVRVPDVGSPAIDICEEGEACVCEVQEDQLGASRPTGLSCDAGSIEVTLD